MSLPRAFYAVALFASQLVAFSQVGPRLEFAPRPADRFFTNTWHLENRRYTTAERMGPDINVRKAWAATKGAGVTIAIVDDGVELEHYDLVTQQVPDLHYSFGSNTNAGGPVVDRSYHGTAVAGLAVADENARGMVGVAPEARFASWVVYGALTSGDAVFVTPEQLAKMFQYASNRVDVQNHSWAKPTGARNTLVAISPGEMDAISNAVRFGRGGLGVVIVHAAGNDRATLAGNANEDAYKSHPDVITVAASRFDGRFGSYSEPGACILVAAPGGDFNGETLFTTDRMGTKGRNFINFFDPEYSDYIFDGLGMIGTSGAAPQVSGAAALMLSANSRLSYRDVQQILMLTARHVDLIDPDVRANGAGLLVSHNLGYGIIDAGRAVELALAWPVLRERKTFMAGFENLTIVTNTIAETQPIPDAGARLFVEDLAETVVAEYPAMPGLGSIPRDNTALFPVTYAGVTVPQVTLDLTNKAALIRRTNSVDNPASTTAALQLQNAVNAGAKLAIMFNSETNDTIFLMGATELVTQPSAFISGNSGQDLLARLNRGEQLKAQLRFLPARYNFQVPNSLLCERIGVRIKTTHPKRGQLRVTLHSPSGTRSVFQSFNADQSAGPVDWTYYSTQHYFEQAQGQWQVDVVDLYPGDEGSVTEVQLIVRGAPLVDGDLDGLQDAWEQTHFGSLGRAAAEDSDNDGYSNAREQVMGRNPAVDESIYTFSINPWDERFTRLSWTAQNDRLYDIWATDTLNAPFQFLTNSVGRAPENAIVLPNNGKGSRFFQLRPR